MMLSPVSLYIQEMTLFISYLILDRLIQFENVILTIFKELTIVVMRRGMHNMWENLIYWKAICWQVPLTDRAREISACVATDGSF